MRTSEASAPRGAAQGGRWWWSFWPVFSLSLVVPTAMLLVSNSYPGGVFLLWSVALLWLGLAAIAWLYKVVIGWRGEGWSWWYVVAPIGGVIALVLLVARAPLDARFALSRSAFDRDVAQFLADTEGKSGRGQTRGEAVQIGSYTVSFTERVEDAVLYHDSWGSGLLDDAGFAYLPDGPTADLENAGFEDPQWHHLSGPWWSWTASW